MNIATAFTKFDELEAFIHRVNKGNPISVICLNECWLRPDTGLKIFFFKNVLFIDIITSKDWLLLL